MDYPAIIPEWLRLQFEDGVVPMDDPPGLTERYYAAWRAAGGQVLRHPREAPITPPLPEADVSPDVPY